MNVGIVGAGLIGSLLATRLLKQGYNVKIFEQDSVDKATPSSPAFIAAGMLSQYSESISGGKSIFEMGNTSIALWDNYLVDLGILQAISKNGSLLLAHGLHKAELYHYIDKIKVSTNSSSFYAICDKATIEQLEPEISYTNGVFISKEANLNSPLVLEQLRHTLIKNQAIHFNAKIDCSTNGIILFNQVLHEFNFVIDCTGINTKFFNNIRGVRGEIITVYAPKVNIMRPIRLFHPKYSIYIVPYPNNTYVIGATEIEAHDLSNLSIRSAIELLTYATTIHSGFWEARIVKFNANVRPTLPDNLPQIKVINKLIAINGLYRHGFLVSPAIVEDIICFIQNKPVKYSNIWNHHEN
ncbi:MAG: FAD-dependent oxidoreductase [Burkholderiales bacterium]|nr:FAD-dependent oxidoreductase [Burkholderiales bacterium]